MKTSLVVTFTGLDRPGLVDALARAVAEHGGNWERSRMARLAGRFAGVLEVTAAPAKSNALVEALERVPGLSVKVERDAAPATAVGERRLHLELTGQDREGIVREVAGALAQRGVNIEQLESDVESAPMSGEGLFRARAELICPPELDLAELKAALERLSNELLVDLELAPERQA